MAVNSGKKEMIPGDITPPRFGLTTVTHDTVTSNSTVRSDFRVSGDGKEKSIVVCTDKKEFERLAESIKTSSLLMKSGSPSIFKLPLEKNDIGIDGCKSYTFGQNSLMRNRTVIFLGATGSGKSTLINGMINYILGVDWKDSFRFKLIDEGQLKSKTESQTSHVIAYKVNYQGGFRVPYSLTLVDTPGFGDRRGIDRDRAITEQIRRLFTSPKGVCEIDAVCFVIPASLARLTATQKYVYYSVQSVFGEDVAENMCMLLTFADSQQSPVLEAINAAKIPCPKTNKGLPVHHNFNNSALFADNRSVRDSADEESDEDMEFDNFDEMYWAMGAKSLKRFFTALDKMTTRSLQLTKEVITDRRQPEAAVEGLQPQVRARLAKPEEIRSTQRQIEKHDATIPSNENVEGMVEILKPVKITQKKGETKYMTNFQQCSVTCHNPCAIADHREKRRYAAMSDGKCRVKTKEKVSEERPKEMKNKNKCYFL